MTACFDSNVLLYSFDLDSPQKKAIAERVVAAVISRRGTLPAQIASEFLAVIHRKQLMPLPEAREVVARISDLCTLVFAQAGDLNQASETAERFRLQYFDALLCTVAAGTGATLLFSEDMQDGLRMGPLTIVNPFRRENRDRVEATIAR